MRRPSNERTEVTYYVNLAIAEVLGYGSAAMSCLREWMSRMVLRHVALRAVPPLLYDPLLRTRVSAIEVSFTSSVSSTLHSHVVPHRCHPVRLVQPPLCCVFGGPVESPSRSGRPFIRSSAGTVSNLELRPVTCALVEEAEGVDA